MYEIIYRSLASPGLQEEDLVKILANSRYNNKQHAISGVLLYFNNSFLQILEGERNDLELLYSKIEIDRRHNHSKIISAGAINERMFGDWSMSFKSLSEDELSLLPGYTDLPAGAINSTPLANSFEKNPEQLQVFKKELRDLL